MAKLSQVLKEGAPVVKNREYNRRAWLKHYAKHKERVLAYRRERYKACQEARNKTRAEIPPGSARFVDQLVHGRKMVDTLVANLERKQYQRVEPGQPILHNTYSIEQKGEEWLVLWAEPPDADGALGPNRQLYSGKKYQGQSFIRWIHLVESPTRRDTAAQTRRTPRHA